MHYSEPLLVPFKMIQFSQVQQLITRVLILKSALVEPQILEQLLKKFKNCKILEVPVNNILRKIIKKIVRMLNNHHFQLVSLNVQQPSYWDNKWNTFEIKLLPGNKYTLYAYLIILFNYYPRKTT